MEMKIMDYDEIMYYINNGYEPLYDLGMLLKYNYLNNHHKYKIWLFEDTKYIDVHGGNMVEKHEFLFGRLRKVCYATDRNYIAE